MVITKPSQSSSLIICRLYRNLLRASKPYTTSPDARVLNCLLHRTGVDDDIQDWDGYVAANPDTENIGEQARDLSISYGRSNKDNVVPHNRTHHVLFRRLLREVVAGHDGTRRMNFPSQVDTSIIQSVIRREFRDDISSVSKSFDHLTRRQVAFTALRELNRKISFFEKAKHNSPEYLPQQAAWHVSPLPFSPPAAYLKPGAFLVSHPKMTDSFFSKSVICLLDRKYNNGQTYGVIINRTSVNTETGRNRTLKEAFDDNMLPTKLAEAFGDLEVKRGGPVHVALQMLYSLPGSEENSIGGSIIPMIPDDDDSSTAIFSDRATYFQGDVFKAITAVEKGTLDREDISFFVGASTWAPGQLEEEVSKGYWIPCRGPPDIALTGICEHEPVTESNRRPLADLWLSMLSSCGRDECILGSLFHEQEWDENLLPCDTFEDEGDLDIDVHLELF